MTRKWAWVSAAISSMWIAVLFTSLFAPRFEAVSASGDVTKIPLAGIVVAGVAFVATIVVAATGFKDGTGRDVELLQEQVRRKELETRLAELEGRIANGNEAPPQARHRILHGR